MRIVWTVAALTALVVVTALSVTLPGYYERTDPPHPLVWFTIALWALFAIAFLLLRRVEARRVVVALVLAGTAATGVAALLGPPNTSTDSARYAWDGIVANAGISPYDHVPADPELAALRPDWLFPAAVDGECGPRPRIMTFDEPGTGEVLCSAINRATVPTIYPPAAELLFTAVRFVVGPEAQYLPMQVVGLLMSLGVTALLLRQLRRAGRDPAWAALWGWCPLVATEGITNSHVDMLGALLLVAATALSASRRPWLAGLALGAAISAKLMPGLGAIALLRRSPLKLIAAAVGVFALLYVPYVLISGVDVLGYLPGYLSEEGYVSGDRFVLVSLLLPGPAALVVSAILIVALAALVIWRVDPDDPWLGQLVMIGGTLLIVSPRYPWYALLLVPMIAMTGRWEWMLVPLALTERLLFSSLPASQAAIALAIAGVATATVWRRRRITQRYP